MDPLVRAVQWFNHACPWNQPKPSLAKRVARRLERGGGPRVYGGIAGSLRMRLDVSHELDRDLALNATNNRLIQLYRRLLRPGDIYVDAGANLGQLALVAARAVGPSGRVYAFECGPAAVARLRENVALNGFGNVEVVDKACWDSCGSAELHEFAGGELDLLSLGQRPDRTVARSFTVATVRIDDVVSEAQVKLVKIDVEGAERAAIHGAERVIFESARRPHLVLECNARTSAAFGYHPLDLVDEILERAPAYRLHLVRNRRMHAITRDGLARLMGEEPGKHRNVWFEA
jgi:FkbM family methyltransferase